MTTDYRALAQPEPEGPTQGGAIALLEQLRAGPDDHKDYEKYEDGWIDACNAAIDALLVAQPEPEGPTDEELFRLEDLRDAWNAQADAFNSWDELGLDEVIWFAQRQALARFARPTITPVPVSEGPPGEKDPDHEGTCWMWQGPGHALPLPAALGEAKP